MCRLDPRGCRGLRVWSVAIVAAGAVAGGLDGWGSGSPAHPGLLDAMASPALHGLPIPAHFTAVATREWPHGFDNEPTLPQSADIEVTLRTSHTVSAIPVLRAVERRLVRDWGCAYAAARLDVVGFADDVDCQSSGGVGVEYRAHDWDVRNWRRRTIDEITVSVTTATPED